MSYLKQNSWLNQQHNQFHKLGFKENILILIIFSWSGLAILFFSFLSRFKSSSVFITFSLLILGISAAFLTMNIGSALTQFSVLVSFVLLLISLDCYHNKFLENAFIHLSNSGYIGLGFYFVIMDLYPGNFPELWQNIIRSAPQAFNMLILCLVFQNIGYYILPFALSPIVKSLETWANSSKNLINLTFIKHEGQQLFLLNGLIFLGSMSRLWNLSLGKVYYTEGSGIPFYISSFLAQFNPLYTVAILYSYIMSLSSRFKNKTTFYISSTLIIFELLYQLLSGSKGRFFNAVIIPIISAYFLVRQRISQRIFILLGGLSLISWLLVYPLLTVYRSLISLKTANPGISIDPILLFNQSVQFFSSFSSEKYLETILTPLNSSGSTEQVIAMTSIIHYQVSQEGILLWQRLFSFWIPRFLWNDKPTNLSANLIGRISGRLGAEDFATSVVYNASGELFIYYGLWGSSLMIIAGLLLRWFNTTTSPFKIYNFFRLAAFITYYPSISNFGGGGFEATLTGTILQFLVFYLTLFVIRILTIHE